MQKAECPPGASIRRREPAKTKDAAIGCVLCRRSLVPSKWRQTITRPCFRRSARIACPRDGTGLTSPGRPTARRVLAPGAALPPWRCVGRSSPPKIEPRLFAFVTSVVRSRWRRVQQRAENPPMAVEALSFDGAVHSPNRTTRSSISLQDGRQGQILRQRLPRQLSGWTSL